MVGEVGSCDRTETLDVVDGDVYQNQWAKMSCIDLVDGKLKPAEEKGGRHLSRLEIWSQEKLKQTRALVVMGELTSPHCESYGLGQG
jgi:hypothetical protein